MKTITVILFAVCGCGLQNIAEETQNAVESSNTKQEDILKALERTERLTAALKALMEKTADGVHLQVLTVALEQMLSPKNTTVLTPPVRMMPFADAFAREATPLELVQTAHLLYRDALLSPETEIHSRLVAIVAMSLLGAFTPEGKIESIVKDQIVSSGLYESTAYVFFAGRFLGIRDYFFNDILENFGILNLGTLRESTALYLRMKVLVQQPFVSKLEINIPSLGIDVKVDPGEIRFLGDKAHNRYFHALKPELLESSEIAGFLAILKSRAVHRFSRFTS